MILLGISAKAQSGKTTFYEISKELIKEVGIYKISFADALRSEIYHYILAPNGIKIDVLTDNEVKEQFRPLLQWYGTQFRRKLNLPERFISKDPAWPTICGYDNYWIDKTRETIESLADTDAIAIIDDVRFANEANMIKEIGGVLIRINRQGIESGTHQSEIDLDSYAGFDYTIENNGDLEGYKGKIEKLLREDLCLIK